MADESAAIPANQSDNQQRTKRKYVRRQPNPISTQLAAPNPNIVQLESELLPLLRQRDEANLAVRAALRKANAATVELDAAREDLQQIEGAVQYRMTVIAQLKGGPLPMPPAGYAVSPTYTPSTPFPTIPPPQAGVGSLPAPNRGLYPDATPRHDEGTGIDYNDGAAVREPMSGLESRYGH